MSRKIVKTVERAAIYLIPLLLTSGPCVIMSEPILKYYN